MPGMLRGLHACARGGKFLWCPTVLLTGRYVKLGIGNPYSLINGTLLGTIGYMEPFFFFLAYLSRHSVEPLYVELLCYSAAVLALCRRIRVMLTARHLC